VGVKVLRSVLEDAIKLQAGVFVDRDVWESTFFGDGKVLPGRMNCNGANAIYVLPKKNLLGVVVDVVYLIGVAGGEDDNVVLQVVNVEPLERGHSVAAEELVVPSAD
jgi:hypothetical protein